MKFNNLGIKAIGVEPAQNIAQLSRQKGCEVINDFFNSILLITADKSMRYNRILLRKNIPENQIEKRMALQMPESEKQKQAQTTIKNNGNMQELHTQLELFWKKLNIS